MATKKKQVSYDADYNRWGHSPGAIKVNKPKKTNKKSNKK